MASGKCRRNVWPGPTGSSFADSSWGDDEDDNYSSNSSRYSSLLSVLKGSTHSYKVDDALIPLTQTGNEHTDVKAMAYWA